jgi:UDP-N-acetylmuramate dehydrogenase
VTINIKGDNMVLEGLKNITNENNIFINEPLRNHSTFRIGGNCDYLVAPKSIIEIKKIIAFANENNIKIRIIGNGSNILFSDDGFRGIILKTTRLNALEIDNDIITAMSGARLSKMCDLALKSSLGGITALAGIPGTVGGAVYMNAGAYGWEIKDTLESSTYLDENLNLLTIDNNEHSFSYRKSFFSHKNLIILSSRFKLLKSNYNKLKEETAHFLNMRAEKQPLNFPNAGSTFKRPEGYFAGKLIEDCGLKGFSIGDAMVSEKHSGFVINKGNATAKDVLELIEYIKKKVLSEYNILLETEIEFVG